MLSDPTKYAVVASLIIGTMLLLFINIIAKNRIMNRSLSAQIDQTAAAAEPPIPETPPESPPVYPFYVDCSLSLPKRDVVSGRQ